MENAYSLRAQLTQPGLPRWLFALAIAGWGVLLIALIRLAPELIALQLAGTAVVALFIYRPDLPIYLIAATYPFIEWQITRGSLNAPVVDIIATAAIFAWALRQVWSIAVHKQWPRGLDLWGWPVFVLWIAVTGASAVFSFDQLTSIKYVVRFLVFFYVAFVWLPLNDINRPRVLSNVLMIMYMVGVAIGLYGLFGFMTVDAPSLLARRAVPVDIFGLYPLGTNHNIIADVMVTTIPVAFFLMQYHDNPQRQKILFIGLAVMLTAALLTFSRSGWLALIVELGVLIALLYRHHMGKLIRYGVIIATIMSPLLVYMLLFSSQTAVQSSNYNRTILNEIAWDMFSERPAFGQGPGSFIPTVSNNRVYIEEFGAPLDAHGFVQKIGAEMGVVGLLAYLALLAAVARRLYRTYHRFVYNDVSAYLLASLMMMVVGVTFFQLFQTSYFVGKLWFPIGVALAAAAITTRQLSNTDQERV